jgi:hypothetical protein
MPIYEMKSDWIERLDETSFKKAGIKERTDLQRLLRHQIEVISPDTLVIAEEFGEWEDSRRRIDLLGLDKEANLVVIELKRTEDGGHMELQAIRYAAMVSTLTFEKVVEIYGDYLEKMGSDDVPRESILEFLGWDEEGIDEDQFAQDVRIVLASAEFSKELTTAVMWLNDRDIDIKCIRLKPYSDGDRMLLDVQQIIPLPEAEQYQVQVREKTRRERIAREQSRDFTKFDITIEGNIEPRMNKRNAIFRVVSHLCLSGVNPEQIKDVIPRRKNRLFEIAEGKLNSDQFIDVVHNRRTSEGKLFEPGRYFCQDENLVHSNEKTYAFTKMWGSSTEETIKLLITNFPDQDIQFKISE